MRPVSSFIALGSLIFGCAASPVKRPAVDLSAMHEAMDSAQIEEDFASSASYAHFLMARLAHHEGDHRKAVDELRLGLASDDGNPFLITSLAEEYARLSELPKAERELGKMIERHPSYQPGQLLLGRVLVEGHKFARARVHLRKAIHLRPKDPEPYLVLAQLALETNAPQEAIKVIDSLATALPGEAVGYRRLGLALAERGDLPRAQGLLEKAVDRDPGDFESWSTLAQIYEQHSEGAKAEAAYDKALERDPDNLEVLFAAGTLSLKDGSAVRAKAYFDRLLSISDDPESAVRIASSYLNAKHGSDAAEVLDAARKTGASEPKLSFYAGGVHAKLGHFALAAQAYGGVPADSELFQEARLNQANCLSLAGQHAAAIALLKKGLSEKPDYLLLYSAYARALERAGQGKEAEAFLVDAIKAQPSPELLQALSMVLQRQGRRSDAIALLLKALAKQPRDETLLYTLGAAYERNGDFDKSVAQMRAVLEVNPENALAMNFIGYILADSGRNLDEAERLLTKALQLRPDEGSFLDSLGWLYFRRGEHERAVSTLEKAAKQSPDEPVIIEHLGDAYRGAARKLQAADAYRRALDALRVASDDDLDPGQRAQIERKLKMLSAEATGR